MSPWNSTLKPGKPLAKRSAKRVIEDREFAKVRELVMERDNHRCQFMRFGSHPYHECWGPLDPHHIVPLSRDSTLRLEPANMVVLCRRAHDVVHDYPLESERVGLLKSAPLLSPQSNQGDR